MAAAAPASSPELEALLAALPALAVPRAPAALAGKRVAIVGGSVGGLAAAACLRAAGFQDVRLFERLASRPAGAGVGLDDAAVAILKGLGALPALALERMRWTEERMADGRCLTRQRFPYCAALYAELQGALTRPLPEGCITAGRRAVDLEQRPDGAVAVHFEAGPPHVCDLVVAADGPFSVLREQLFPSESFLRFSGYFAWRGTARRGELPEATQAALRAAFPALGNCLYFVWRPEAGQHAVLYDIGGGLLNWLIYENRPKPVAGEGQTTAPAPPEAIERLRSEAQRCWGPALGGLLEATAEPFVNDIYDLSEPLRALGRGSVVLLGDAAHPISPHMAKGSNLALHDAFALAAAAAGASDVAAMVAGYSRLRAAEGRRCVLLSRHLGRLRNGLEPAALAASGGADGGFDALVRAAGLPTCTLPGGPLFAPVLNFVRRDVPEAERGIFLDLDARRGAEGAEPPVASSPRRPLQIAGVNHISRETRQVARMRHFYAEVLGLKPLPRPHFGFGGAWFELSPGVMLHIIERDPAKPGPGTPGLTLQDADLTARGRMEERFIRRSHHIALTVTDIEAAKAGLDAHGIRYHVNAIPGTPVAQLFFHDPDGNGIELGNFDAAAARPKL